MTREEISFLKILLIFTISPGFSGIFFLSYKFFSYPNDTNILSITFHDIYITIIFGFFGGLIIYVTPAFILGLIYAKLKLKKNWKSYVFVAVFSPAFLLILEFIHQYLLPKNTDIPGMMRVNIDGLVTIMCPLSSLTSIVAAWLSFPKNQLHKNIDEKA